MLIGEVARGAGVSRDTVRLYTRLGLVTSTPRRAGSRLYADYDPSAVGLVRDIKTAQSVGFTLAELSPIVAAYVVGSLDDARERELLAAKLGQIEGKRQQLARMSEFLRGKLNDLEAAHQNECHGERHRAIQGAPLALPAVTGMGQCSSTRATAHVVLNRKAECSSKSVPCGPAASPRRQLICQLARKAES